MATINMTTDYKFDIFIDARVMYDEMLTHAYGFITTNQAEKRSHNLLYLCIIADYLTAYNELSTLGYFCRMKHFNY